MPDAAQVFEVKCIQKLTNDVRMQHTFLGEGALMGDILAQALDSARALTSESAGDEVQDVPSGTICQACGMRCRKGCGFCPTCGAMLA